MEIVLVEFEFLFLIGGITECRFRKNYIVGVCFLSWVHFFGIEKTSFLEIIWTPVLELFYKFNFRLRADCSDSVSHTVKVSPTLKTSFFKEDFTLN